MTHSCVYLPHSCCASSSRGSPTIASGHEEAITNPSGRRWLPILIHRSQDLAAVSAIEPGITGPEPRELGRSRPCLALLISLQPGVTQSLTSLKYDFLATRPHEE